MKVPRSLQQVLTLLICLSSFVAYAQTDQWVENKALQKIKLENSRGQKIKLRDIDLYKGAVFVFLYPECPLSIKYTKTLNELYERFSEEQILFVGIIPGTDYSKTTIEKFKKTYRLKFDLYLDSEYTLSQVLNAKSTPQVILTDPWGGVQYTGAIDDRALSLGQFKDNANEEYLLLALEKWLMNEPIWPKETKPVGCIIEVPKHP